MERASDDAGPVSRDVRKKPNVHKERIVCTTVRVILHEESTHDLAESARTLNGVILV